MSVFDHPFMLGFEPFERALDRVQKNAEGYPPYNIEQISENRLRITLAVAGFSEGELAIQREGNQLVIAGRQAQQDENRVFLHKGIASRQFQRAFVLAEGLEVENAGLQNGLLHVELMRPEPEGRVQNIPIVNMDKR